MKTEKRPLLLILSMIMGLLCSCGTASAANPPATTAVAVESQEQLETPAPPGATLASAEIIDDRGDSDDNDDTERDDIHLPTEEDAGAGNHGDSDDDGEEVTVDGHDEVPDDSVYDTGHAPLDELSAWIRESDVHEGYLHFDLRGLLEYYWCRDGGRLVPDFYGYAYVAEGEVVQSKVVCFRDEYDGYTLFQTIVYDRSGYGKVVVSSVSLTDLPEDFYLVLDDDYAIPKELAEEFFAEFKAYEGY